jgi:hypothetical protein
MHCGKEVREPITAAEERLVALPLRQRTRPLTIALAAMAATPK